MVEMFRLKNPRKIKIEIIRDFGSFENGFVEREFHTCKKQLSL